MHSESSSTMHFSDFTYFVNPALASPSTIRRPTPVFVSYNKGLYPYTVNQNETVPVSPVSFKPKRSSFCVTNTSLQSHTVAPVHASSTTPYLMFWPGMKDVPVWLKTLRLHKYTSMFQEMSYEEMMALDEQQLERRQVTKGARRKILQSIHKLKQRSAIIRDMEKNLQTPKFPGQRCIRCAIATIRQILSTPLKAYAPSRNESIEKIEGVVPTHLINDDNLPALLFRLIGLVTVMLFGTGKYNNDIEDEYLFMMFSIFDQVVNNDAFTPAQKQRVLHWMRCARKSVCPAELHRQRLGLPHSGKCEACHHKESMTHDPYNTKTAQLKFQQWFSVHPIYVSTKSLGSDVPIQGSHCDMVRILQLPTTKFEWNQDQMMGSAPLSNRYGTSNTREFRSNFDTMQKQEQGPYTAQAFTQQLPQYRSQRSVPCQATSSIESTPPVAHSNPTMWSSAIYGSDFLDMNYTARQHASSGHSKPRNSIDSNELNLKINPWDKSSSLPYEQTDSTSGYSSSASERSSGAGSPRSRGLGQTLYDMAIDLIR